MVTNPIYDGPMYESIHPQFRMVNRQSETAGDGDSKEGGDSRESEHDTELSLPDETASFDQDLSPRYVRNPKSCLQMDRDPPLTDSPLTLSPAPMPTLPQSHHHHRERNVLGLTLDLSESNVNDVGMVRGVYMNDLNGRQTRRRAATTGRDVLE